MRNLGGKRQKEERERGKTAKLKTKEPGEKRAWKEKKLKSHNSFPVTSLYILFGNTFSYILYRDPALQVIL